jgi:diguanylate cyclase (GGDEF)-like protein
MTLFKQLFLGSAILFLVLLLGLEAVYLANARKYVQGQLESQSQNAATSIAMSLGVRGSLANPALVETVIKPVFDRGYFQVIEVTSVNGTSVVRKELPLAEGDVPAWFVRMFQLRPPSSQSIVSSGWNELGRVYVVSHPHFFYLQLWHNGLQTLLYVAIAFALALVGLRAFLSEILRPLRAIEDTAESIAERRFTTVATVPHARELRRVVLTINSLSGKIRRIIEEESARAEHLRKKEYEDPVTALLTRTGLEKEFANIILGGREIYAGVVVLLQIDDLKALNDRRGHAGTDEVLVHVARAIVESCADRVVLTARLTGADFAIAAANLEHAEVRKLLVDICGRVGAALSNNFTPEDISFHCGAAHFESGKVTLSALLASADLALARAREQKSGSFEIIVSNEIQAPVRGSLEWRRTIERALAADRLLLHAMPVMSLPGRTLLHRELLARLVDDDGNVVPAWGFVPMVARHGLLPQLDLAIAQKVFTQIDHDRAGYPRIALNIATQTITNWTAVEQLIELLRAHPRAAPRLIFEMTEFGAARNPEATRAFVTRIRSLGAAFAIDNFGLHQQVLSQLPSLLPDYVKLAASFSQNLVEASTTRELITSLARIAQPLDITLIAQAVEYESILPLLTNLGVGGYQGYICSRPVLFED